MKRLTLVYSLILLAIPALAPAKDFPLEFRALKPEDVKGYQWGYGAVQMITAVKPAAVQKEPGAVSAHPLYGEFKYRSDKTSMLFRLDESKGDGKGYDQLILDLNRNGDLTDDAPVAPVADVQPWSNYAGQELTLFGPIAVPASKWNGPGKPVYYAVLDLRTSVIGLLRKNSVAAARNYLGNLRLRAAWYLETTVEMDGRKQTVAVIDNDANLRLGDPCRPNISSDGRWFLGAADGDRLLLKKDGSGTNYDSRCFASILYFGAVPYKVALAADCNSLQVEPWPGPLAEVSLQPHGERVSGLGLGWESAMGQWQFIEPGVADGRIKVPPGNYGLWGVSVSARSSKGETLTAGGGMNNRKVFSVTADGTNTLLCGTPLEIKVTTDHPDNSSSGGLLSWVGKLFSSESGELRIQAEIAGAGGETYAGFSLADEHGQRQPSKPAFTIATADGKQVASGNLEFG